jgi:hypothetical protein
MDQHTKDVMRLYMNASRPSQPLTLLFGRAFQRASYDKSNATLCPSR